MDREARTVLQRRRLRSVTPLGQKLDQTIADRNSEATSGTITTTGTRTTKTTKTTRIRTSRHNFDLDKTVSPHSRGQPERAGFFVWQSSKAGSRLRAFSGQTLPS